MLKLLIVDDEHFVRQGLRKIIKWEELGITVCGEGENVSSAIAIARSTLPDIVLCDIRLPGGSGFQVAEEIKKMVPWVQVIMVTAYSDKEYMQQAIYQGVCDYLFKPAGIPDIQAAAKRAIEKVKEYQEKVKNDLNHQQFLAENMDVLRENFLRSLLKGSLNKEQVEKECHALGIPFSGNYLAAACFCCEEEGESYRLMQNISARLQWLNPMIVWNQNSEQWIILFNSTEPFTGEQVQKEIEKFTGRKVFVTEICTSMQQLHGKGVPFFEKSEKPIEKPFLREEKREDNEFYQTKETFFEAVKYHDTQEEWIRLFDRMILEGKKTGKTEEQLLKETAQVMEMVGIFTGTTLQEGLPCRNLEERKDAFRKFCEQIQKSQKYQLDDVSGKALYYIKKRHCEDLSLEQVAADLFMSSSYLSRIIKERTGHGFGHWLNYYRIESAKKLLKNGTEPIEAIAEMCGYHSYRIFSDNFKKYAGVTATAYRGR